MDETLAYCAVLRKGGYLIAAEPPRTRQNVHDGPGPSRQVSVTDGPFAKTKEQIGGIFLINAWDLNEALQVASKFPSVRMGCMEVRAVMDLDRQKAKADHWEDIQQHPRWDKIPGHGNRITPR